MEGHSRKRRAETGVKHCWIDLAWLWQLRSLSKYSYGPALEPTPKGPAGTSCSSGAYQEVLVLSTSQLRCRGAMVMKFGASSWLVKDTRGRLWQDAGNAKPRQSTEKKPGTVGGLALGCCVQGLPV